MPRTSRTDPLRNFKFGVQVTPLDSTGLGRYAQGLNQLGFAQMSGISVTNELIPYREGGMNTHPHKMVGQSDFAPVSFARGVFSGQEQLWRWQQFIHAWQGGLDGGSGPGDDYRCDILVKVYDHPITSRDFSFKWDPQTQNGADINQPVKLEIMLYNAWPGAFALSDLNAGDNGILIQQLQVHHEGFTINWRGDTAQRATTYA